MRITVDVLESEAVLTAEDIYCGHVTRTVRIIQRDQLLAEIKNLLTTSESNPLVTAKETGQDWLNQTCPA